MIVLGIEREGKYILFRHVGTTMSGKTQYWRVKEKESERELGMIQWFGRWKCYAFSPNPETVYEKSCLREIADFCEEFTRRHVQGEY